MTPVSVFKPMFNYFNDMSLQMSSVRFNVGTVEPPKGYVRKINAGKMNFDIVTYTDYARNISQQSLKNSVPLNSRNKGCKALLTIPQATNANSVTKIHSNQLWKLVRTLLHHLCRTNDCATKSLPVANRFSINGAHTQKRKPEQKIGRSERQTRLGKEEEAGPEKVI